MPLFTLPIIVLARFFLTKRIVFATDTPVVGTCLSWVRRLDFRGLRGFFCERSECFLKFEDSLKFQCVRTSVRPYSPPPPNKDELRGRGASVLIPDLGRPPSVRAYFFWATKGGSVRPYFFVLIFGRGAFVLIWALDLVLIFEGPRLPQKRSSFGPLA